MIISAGLAIICNKKILLIHPTNAPWYARHSIPKGQLENDEEIIDCAIREVYEEIGVLFDVNNILPKQYEVEYVSNKNKPYKKVYYYLVYLSEEPELKKENFQLEEVDWAGFLSYDEAKTRILEKQLDILKHIK